MYHTRTIHSVTVGDVECELQHEPVDGSELTAQVGDNLVVAYLVYDDDNRLEDLMGDCMGKLYSFERHSRDIGAGLTALGNTSDGEPDLDEVWDKHSEEATKRYLNKVRLENSFQDVRSKLDIPDLKSWPNCMEALSRDCSLNDWYNVEYNDTMEEVLTHMWAEPEFFPGDRDAQTLACYDHSGQHWSLSGQGMQCRWDTSNRAGVWVPDDYLRKELDDVAPRAAYTFVRGTSWIRGTGKSYQLVSVSWEGDKPTINGIEFSDDAAPLHAKAREIADLAPAPSQRQIAWGREQMARVYCQQFLDTYNDIISGQVFGCVVETFDLNGVQVEEDACWGFVGDYAEESLKAEFFEPACVTAAKVGDCV